MNGFGPRIKMIRIKFNKTQREVADKLMMKQSQYSRIESDKSSFPVDRLCDLADLYGVSVDFLLGHERNPDSFDKSPIELQLDDAGLRYSFVDGRVKIRLLGKFFYVTPEKLGVVLEQARKKSVSLYCKVTEKIIESCLFSILLKLDDSGDLEVDME